MTRILIVSLSFIVAATAALADGPPAHDPTAIYPGTESFTAPKPASEKPKGPNDVTLNFPNADVHEVAKAILGDILGYNYSVDTSATGTVTVVTAEPVARADVLPILEESLSVAHLGLIKKGDVYTIVALDKAKKQPQLLSAGQAGYGSEAITLHYVNAVELKKLLDPLVPENAIGQADQGRNILLITGTEDQRNSLRDLIKQFDVNWLKGMSFGLLVPQHTDAHMLLPELDAIVNTPNSPTQGLVKLVMIDRINGILAISPQPQYLRDLRKWMEVLDRAGGENERRLFVYHVQNGRAADLATVLINAFGGGGSTSTTAHPTAPNLTATGQASQIQGSTSGFGTTGQPGGGFGASGPTGFQTQGFGATPFGQNQNTDNNSSMTPGSTSTQPQNVSQTLQLPGGGTPITVSSDENNNAIVVWATQRQYATIEDALKQLDTQPVQVVIEAAITEVSLTKELQFGVQWLLNSGVGQVGFSQGPKLVPKPVLPGFNWVIAGGNEIQATLNALQAITTVKVVSAPKVLVLNNHTASLQVGDQVPISTGSLSTQTGGVPDIATETSYMPTGVLLTVTPRVNDNGLVLLDISQEVSEVKETTSSTINSPTITDRKFNSSIAVHDGQTIALGGLIQDNNSHSREGIPYLSQIPYLGALFGSTDNKDDRTELLVLLTPRVIRSPEDAKSVTEELKEKIGTVAPPGPPRGEIH